MTVETKGWCLDNRNCSLSVQYLIPFCGYKLVGCGCHKNTLLKSVRYAYRKFSDEFPIVSFLQLWPKTLMDFGS